MKLRAVIFSLTALYLSCSAIAQPDRVYTLAEARLVHPDSVFRLDLSKSKLREIPNEIFVFKNLTELNLSQNKLTGLPDSFFFPHLEILNIEKNDLDTFPAALCNNVTLKQLLMGKNNMTALPECIGGLASLTVLDIWFNPVRELPMSMTELRNLRSLDMRGITYSDDFQEKWSKLLPWVKIEFDLGCDCGY